MGEGVRFASTGERRTLRSDRRTLQRAIRRSTRRPSITQTAIALCLAACLLSPIASASTDLREGPLVPPAPFHEASFGGGRIIGRALQEGELGELGLDWKGLRSSQGARKDATAEGHEGRHQPGQQEGLLAHGRLFGVEFSTHVGVDEGFSALDSAEAAVDVDRLRSLATGKSRDAKPVALFGELQLGSVASVRIGYETRQLEDGSAIPVGTGRVGAGIEYNLGSGGTVAARYHWGTGEQSDQNGADFGVTYRIGEDASLRASYSMIRFFDAARGNDGKSLAEAKLFLRF